MSSPNPSHWTAGCCASVALEPGAWVTCEEGADSDRLEWEGKGRGNGGLWVPGADSCGQERGGNSDMQVDSKSRIPNPPPFWACL